ncbi:hypothetical protein [Nostoc sp.]|uniref:hypothetical protein n=1 Tax=Nostoc sp. TaxID=1180 RepID=UPI002FFB631B
MFPAISASVQSGFSAVVRIILAHQTSALTSFVGEWLLLQQLFFLFCELKESRFFADQSYLGWLRVVSIAHLTLKTFSLSIRYELIQSSTKQ